MSRYWRHELQGEQSPASPAPGALQGGQPLERAPWESAMRGQDYVGVASRRVIMQAGVGIDRGGWRFTTEGPTSGSAVTYALGRAQLTSGCVLRCSVLYLPSGGATVSTSEPTEGILRLSINWQDRDSNNETHTINVLLEHSDNDDFLPTDGAGAAFGELREKTFTITPPVDLDDEAEANAWTVSPTVEIQAFQIGGTRIVDMCVYEIPYQVCMESDDPGTEWTSHVFATSAPEDSSNASSPRPRTRRSETSPDGNPRGGTRLTMDVANAQRSRYGPQLLYWSNYQEATSSTTTGLDGITVSSDGCVFDSTQSAYDDTAEGLSVSCGGYGRRWRDNNGHILGTEDAECAIPVVLRVYGSTSSGTVRVLLNTSEHSWVECELDSGNGWSEGFGLLKVGINPSDITVAQPFVVGLGYSQTVDIWAISLERAII